MFSNDSQEELASPVAQFAYSYLPGSFTARWTNIADADGYLLDISDNHFFTQNESGILLHEKFTGPELPCGWNGNTQFVGNYYVSGPKSLLVYKYSKLNSPKCSYPVRLSFYVRSDMVYDTQVCISYVDSTGISYLICCLDVDPSYQIVELDLSQYGIVNLSEKKNVSFSISSGDENIYIDDFKVYTDPLEHASLSGSKNLVVSDTSYILSELLECKTYYYRVRAFKGFDTSSYSNIVEVFTNNSNISLNPNPDKPHKACDFNIYIPADLQQNISGTELRINELRYSPKELIPGDTFKCTYGGLQPDLEYDFAIRLVNGSFEKYNETVKYKSLRAPINEEKTVLLVIDNELNTSDMEPYYLEYEHDIANLYRNYSARRYYIGNTFEEKKQLYSYIKENYTINNLFYVFFIGENASMPVYFEKIDDDSIISQTYNRENFSFYAQLYNNMYDYDSTLGKFVHRTGTGKWDKPDSYSRIISNGGIDINYGVLISPEVTAELRAGQIANYLDKVHNFKHGNITFEKRALYSNTWESLGNQSLANALQSNPRWKNSKGINTSHEPSSGYHGSDSAWTAEYLYSLENESFEICYLNVHGAPTYHYFDINYSDINELKALNTALFSLQSCNNASYTTDNFMGGTYLMKGHVLALEGFTHPTLFVSSTPNDTSFDPGSDYYAISAGARFSRVLNQSMPSHVFFGDPMLGLNEHIMRVDSCNSLQDNFNYVKPGDESQHIMMIKVYADGDLKGKKEARFHFTSSCTDNRDISGVKLFYTGIKSFPDTLHQVGTTIRNMVDSMVFSDSIDFIHGLNYFWLAYDLDLDATNGNIADAEFISLSSSGENLFPIISNPEGSRKIYAASQPVTLPWIESFEEAEPVSSYQNNTSNITGLPWWSIWFSESHGRRLNLKPDSLWCYSGEHAAKMEIATPYDLNSCLTATINLENYVKANDLELSFYCKGDGIVGNVGGRVELRGADTLEWIEAYSFGKLREQNGIWQYVTGIDIDSILSDAGQNPTASFEIRFTFENEIYSSINFSVDDITLTGSPPIALSEHPGDISSCENDQVSLGVETENTESLIYHWYKNGELLESTGRISGVQSKLLSITNVELGDSGNYACLIQNAGQSVLSNAAFLEVLSGPTASLLHDTVVCEGSKAILIVQLAGKQPWELTYKNESDTFSIITYQNTVQIQDSTESRYQLYYVNDAGGCEGTILRESAKIELHNNPSADFSHSTNDLEVEFINTSVDATEYFWDFGDSSTSTLMNPVHLYRRNDTYTVTLIAYNEFCVSPPHTEQIALIGNPFPDIFQHPLYQLYPNPCSGKLYFISTVSDDIIRYLTITNSYGQIVYKEKLSAGEVQKIIDVESFSNGIYVVLIQGKTRVYAEQIMLLK